MTSTYNIKQGDCLELMKGLPDGSVDLIFCDPPYALGSEVRIKENGKPEYKKAVDFMNKWDQPDGAFWEEWFYEAKRVLKHGGHCLMFGMDRQLWFNCYYANLSGFTQKQSLYWYFISNFPKASDLSKNLDKYFGAERKIIGQDKNFGKTKDKETFGDYAGEWDISKPSTPLAKKYEGIKYSVAPLKQVVENIMVFQKPYKTGSCLHDVLALEAGDNTITCGGVDIEGNRCETMDDLSGGTMGGVFGNGKKAIGSGDKGRFPAQTYISSEASEIIDLQSGKMGMHPAGNKKDVEERDYNASGYKFGTFKHNPNYHNDAKESAGKCSRILHRCDYEAGDYYLYHYCPKVSKSERNEGLEGIEKKASKTGIDTEGRTNNDLMERFRKKPESNNHPTVKPKALLSKILKLFKTPNDQVLLDPFMGSGSMGISAVETGFEYIGYELDQDYYKIAENRILKAKNQLEQILV